MCAAKRQITSCWSAEMEQLIYIHRMLHHHLPITCSHIGSSDGGGWTGSVWGARSYSASQSVGNYGIVGLAMPTALREETVKGKRVWGAAAAPCKGKRKNSIPLQEQIKKKQTNNTAREPLSNPPTRQPANPPTMGTLNLSHSTTRQ